jgi:hypothetical protein
MEKLMDLLIDDHLQFSDEHKHLLRAQVLLTEAQERTDNQLKELAEAQKRGDEKLAQAQKELYEAQKHTDERMDALIAVVDDLIRREPKRPQ